VKSLALPVDRCIISIVGERDGTFDDKGGSEAAFIEGPTTNSFFLNTINKIFIIWPPWGSFRLEDPSGAIRGPQEEENLPS